MQNIIKALQDNKNKKMLIITHHNADIDAMSSIISLHLGLKQKGINTTLGVSQSISRPAKKLSKNFEINKNPDCKDYDYIIIVETSVPEQLKGVKNLKADMIIDHHPPSALAENSINWIDEKSKSSTQMIYKLLKQLDCEITPEIASLILAGIVADTAHLRIAEIEEFKTIIELLKKGVKYSEVLQLIETPKEISERIASLKAGSRLKLYNIGNILIVFSRVASHEAAACRALLRLGADISVVAAEKRDELRISSRARNDILEYNIDLSEIFKEVGNIIEGTGGGHNLAGSANGKNKRAANPAFKYILKQLSEKIGKRWKKIE